MLTMSIERCGQNLLRSVPVVIKRSFDVALVVIASANCTIGETYIPRPRIVLVGSCWVKKQYFQNAQIS